MVATVVMECWADVPTVDSMGGGHVSLMFDFSCTSIFVPGGVSGVRL
jgi:hypothetical protein